MDAVALKLASEAVGYGSSIDHIALSNAVPKKSEWKHHRVVVQVSKSVSFIVKAPSSAHAKQHVLSKRPWDMMHSQKADWSVRSTETDGPSYFDSACETWGSK